MTGISLGAVIVLGVIATIGVTFAIRRFRIEWRLLKSENESLAPFSARLHALAGFWLEQTAEPVVFLASDGTINGVSNAAERMLGQRSVLLVGRPIQSFFADGCEAYAAISKALQTGEEIRRQTVKMKLVHGQERTADLVARRFKTKEKDEWWILFKG